MLWDYRGWPDEVAPIIAGGSDPLALLQARMAASITSGAEDSAMMTTEMWLRRNDIGPDAQGYGVALDAVQGQPGGVQMPVARFLLLRS